MVASVLWPWRVLVAVVLVGTFWAACIAVGEESKELRLPPDTTYQGAASSPGPVVFSHKTHVSFVDNRCVACHPSLFPMLRPTGRISHDDMNAGKKCGACHDGTKASGVQENCDRCHKMGGGP